VNDRHALGMESSRGGERVHSARDTDLERGPTDQRLAQREESPPRLTPSRLKEAQRVTLSQPRMRYGPLARALFASLDLLYGRRRTLSKFKVLELVARVPYQAWEHVAYVAVTHTSSRPGFARNIFERVQASRSQQDNEQWHLLILEELSHRTGVRENWIWHWLLPQLIAAVYYQISWVLYVMRPAWSYRLNASFEDHAEHEYMLFVQENTTFETTPWESEFAGDYGRYETLADLFRQIGHDERVHKAESLEMMRAPRFRRA
jgi:ubiquinol oxidase